ncbi:MAG: DUF418 domain-containing protein [Planctomycetota bacterium]|nr:DUF418 domain-containing protein [Planctomycetota bacterium]MEC9156686.1 DUF418 domain-containing protein [Planctomycetota bacterium]
MNTGKPAPPAMGLRSVAPADRIESIDALRGFALLGILVVNTLFFALPVGVGLSTPGSDPAVTPSGDEDWLAWWIVNLLFEYKFMTLFSILFGVGAAIQFDRTRRAGRSFSGFFARRMVVLLGFGILHAVLLWYGDVLAIYACCGLVLLLLIGLPDRLLILIASLMLLFTAITSAGMLALETSLAGKASVAEEPLRGLDAIWSSEFNPMSAVWIQAEQLAYGEGPIGDLFAFRITTWLVYLATVAFSTGWHVLAMFMVGVVLFRRGFFAAEGARLRRLALLFGLPLGLALEAACTWLTARYAGETSMHAVWPVVIHEFSVPLVSVGYAALVVWIARTGALCFLMHGLSSVGRMALTCYILETVVMTSVFYYYGLGLFGTIERIHLIPVALGTWGLLAFGSVAWLNVFRQGPLEWLWRALTYGPSRGRG